MTPAQRDLLMKVLDAYAGLMADDIAADRMAKIRTAGLDRLAFAWAGPLERGQKHYYRVQGPTILIEFDNTQGNGNHVHAVWRDFAGDFGRDLLREHSEDGPLVGEGRLALGSALGSARAQSPEPRADQCVSPYTNALIPYAYPGTDIVMKYCGSSASRSNESPMSVLCVINTMMRPWQSSTARDRATALSAPRSEVWPPLPAQKLMDGICGVVFDLEVIVEQGVARAAGPRPDTRRPAAPCAAASCHQSQE